MCPLSGQVNSYRYIKIPDNLFSYRSFVTVKMDVNTRDLSIDLSKYKSIKNYDYTRELQNLINRYKKVKLPPYIMLINDSGISIPSNARVYFSKGTVLKMKSSHKTHFDALKIYDVKDVQIYNATIIGDKKTHLGTQGEWAAGIGIRNSTDVIVQYGNISDTWGDGVFIGSENGGVSKNIKVSDLNIDNARRNGISLTSGNNVLVQNVTISNTSGTMPMCGIDIEPSLPEEELINIKFNNITTFNNANVGFSINTNMFSSPNKDYKKKVSILIENHRDYDSPISMGYSIDANDFRYKPTGIIIYKNGISNNSTHSPYWKTSQKKGIKFSVQNFTIKKGNTKKIFHDENF